MTTWPVSTRRAISGREAWEVGAHLLVVVEVEVLACRAAELGRGPVAAGRVERVPEGLIVAGCPTVGLAGGGEDVFTLDHVVVGIDTGVGEGVRVGDSPLPYRSTLGDQPAAEVVEPVVRAAARMR